MNQEVLAALMAILASIGQTTGNLQQQVEQLTKAIAAVASPSPVVTVRTAAELTVALDAAVAGTTIKLAPGRYVGNFVLRARPGDAVTTITTDATIPEGRATAAQEGTFAVLASPNTDCVVRTQPGAAGYALVGIQVAEVNGGYASICLGTDAETTLEQFPSRITLDRVLIRATGQQRRGVMAIGRDITIRNSHIAGIKFAGEDSQAIWGNGPGPYRIDNNYLEGAGENIMFGGSDPKVPGMVPSDIVITGNHLFKPLTWRGTAYTVKNLLELKNARRVSITDNLLENVWAQAQIGCAVLFTPRNQDGTAPWSTVEDVVFERNTVRNMVCGVSVLGTDRPGPSGTLSRLTIRRNTFVDYGGNYWLRIGDGAQDVTVDHNTLISRSTGSSGVLIAYGTPPMSGFVFTNNVAKHDSYGMIGDAVGIGTVAIQKYFPGAVITKNVLAGGSSSRYPAGNLFPSTTEFAGHFLDPAAGTLKPGTDWAGAGTDGTDLGR